MFTDSLVNSASIQFWMRFFVINEVLVSSSMVPLLIASQNRTDCQLRLPFPRRSAAKRSN